MCLSAKFNVMANVQKGVYEQTDTFKSGMSLTIFLPALGK